MPMISLNDAEFYYETIGVGQPVILISGYACDHTAWMPIAITLSQHFQVVMIDNRASGQTKDSGLVLSAELMASDIVQLLSTLDLKYPHIVGSSMGGTIAQYVATQVPDKIGKLCLCNAVAKWRSAMLEGFGALLALREREVDFELLFKSSLSWLFGEALLNSNKKKEQLRQLMLENPYPQSLEDQKRQYRVLETFDGRKNLANIKAKTLVLYGREDIVSLPRESFYLAEHIKDATLNQFQSAHVPFFERPAEFVDVLIKFLK